VAFSPNGQYVLSGGDDGSVRVWDVSTRESVRDIKLGQPVTCVAFHPDGRRAVGGGDHATIFVIDLEAAATLHKLGGHIGPITGVAVSPDGRQAVSVSDDKTLRFWDVATGKKATFAGPTGNGSFSYLRSAQPLKAVAFAGDGSWVVAAGADSSVTIMTVDGRGQATIHPPGKSGLLALAVAPDGAAVYLGTDHADVRRMDFQGGTDFIPTTNQTTPADTPPEPPPTPSTKPAGLAPKWTAETGTATLQSVAVAAGGRIATGGSDRTVRVWEPDGKEAHSFPNMTAAEQNVAISRDGGTLLVGGSSQERVGRITAGDDCQLRAIALKDNRVGRVGIHASPIRALALSANGRLALTGSDTVVRYWDVVGGREIRQYFGHAGPVRAVDFHPKLAQAVSVAADNSVRVWDLNGTKLIRTITGLPGSPTGVAFSPDGKAILVYGPGVLGTWDAVTGQPLRSFPSAGVPVAAAWAPNGNLVTAVDGVVALRSADDGKELLHLVSPPAAVTALGVSGDGRLIVAAGRGLAAWEPDKPLVGPSPAVPMGR
jgi:WD40 repeat protein